MTQDAAKTTDGLTETEGLSAKKVAPHGKKSGRLQAKQAPQDTAQANGADRAAADVEGQIDASAAETPAPAIEGAESLESVIEDLAEVAVITAESEAAPAVDDADYTAFASMVEEEPQSEARDLVRLPYLTRCPSCTHLYGGLTEKRKAKLGLIDQDLEYGCHWKHDPKYSQCPAGSLQIVRGLNTQLFARQIHDASQINDCDTIAALYKSLAGYDAELSSEVHREVARLASRIVVHPQE